MRLSCIQSKKNMFSKMFTSSFPHNKAGVDRGQWSPFAFIVQNSLDSSLLDNSFCVVRSMRVRKWWQVFFSFLNELSHKPFAQFADGYGQLLNSLCFNLRISFCACHILHTNDKPFHLSCMKQNCEYEDIFRHREGSNTRENKSCRGLDLSTAVSIN